MRHLYVGMDHPFPCQLAFHPNGRGLFGVIGFSLLFWDLEADGDRPAWIDESGGMLFRFAVGPCGRYVAGAEDRCLILWDLEARTPTKWAKWLTAGNSEHIADVAFTPDGREVVTVLLEGGGVVRRRAGTWRKMPGFGASRGRLGGRRAHFDGHLAVSPDGRTLATTHCQSGDGGLFGIKTWDFPSGTHRRTVACGSDSINQLVYSPDGRALVAQHDYRRLCLYDSRSLTPLAEYAPPRPARISNKDPVMRFTFHPNGRMLAASGGTFVTLLDADTLRTVQAFDWEIGGTTGVAFSPEGNLGAVAGQKGRVVVWDID